MNPILAIVVSSLVSHAVNGLFNSIAGSSTQDALKISLSDFVRLMSKQVEHEVEAIVSAASLKQDLGALKAVIIRVIEQFKDAVAKAQDAEFIHAKLSADEMFSRILVLSDEVLSLSLSKRAEEVQEVRGVLDRNHLGILFYTINLTMSCALTEMLILGKMSGYESRIKEHAEIYCLRLSRMIEKVSNAARYACVFFQSTVDIAVFTFTRYTRYKLLNYYDGTTQHDGIAQCPYYIDWRDAPENTRLVKDAHEGEQRVHRKLMRRLSYVTFGDIGSLEKLLQELSALAQKPYVPPALLYPYPASRVSYLYHAPTPTKQKDKLQVGEFLRPGEALTSWNGKYVLSYEHNGNLILAHAGTFDDWLWISNTHGASLGAARIQNDGNFILADASNHPVFTSATSEDQTGHPKGSHNGAFLFLQNDGNLVIYAGSQGAIWASNTVVEPDPHRYLNAY